MQQIDPYKTPGKNNQDSLLAAQLHPDTAHIECQCQDEEPPSRLCDQQQNPNAVNLRTSCRRPFPSAAAAAVGRARQAGNKAATATRLMTH
ncbi:Os04g0623902 [Oryza sativa Japonica Group]|uniref:Os04g0623902 protein n=1 Tax=Oryza sativa subsp. japonica TaxID=39947 RepID=A0A0P0WF37_ORYSJ|nr:Os04g0623902 [Oryza sativa Japonica Group]